MRELGLNWPKPRVQPRDVFHFLPTKVITSLFSSLRQRGASASPLIMICRGCLSKDGNRSPKSIKLKFSICWLPLD